MALSICLKCLLTSHYLYSYRMTICGHTSNKMAVHNLYRMSQFVGGNLCWRFLRKFTFGGFYFGDFLHLQELGVARVNNQLLLADFILAIYLSTANPPTLIPRQQIDSYGNSNNVTLKMYKAILYFCFVGT